MPITIKDKQGTATTKVENLHKGKVVTEETDTEKVGDATPSPLQGSLCEVGVEASMTLNLGNYNSTRLQTSLKVPCAHTEIDEVWEFVRDWVNAKMELLVTDASAPENPD